MPMRLQAFLILFLMLSSVTAPVFDAVACDDCADPVTSRRVMDSTRQLLDFAAAANHDGDHASPSGQTAKDLCPVCANAAAGISTTYYCMPVMLIESVCPPKLLAFSDPSYPINKPPQN